MIERPRHAVVVFVRAKTARHVIRDGAARGEARALRQIADLQARLHEALAGIEIELAGQGLQDGGLAAAIGADQADALALTQPERDPGEERPAAERDSGRRAARVVVERCGHDFRMLN